MLKNGRVKSGIFGQTAKSGQNPCLFHIFKYCNKNKLTKQTVKILMRRLIRMSEFTLPSKVYLTLIFGPFPCQLHHITFDVFVDEGNSIRITDSSD